MPRKSLRTGVLVVLTAVFWAAGGRTEEHAGMPVGQTHEHAGQPMVEGPAAVTGEVIDTFCYATMGAKGESHRQCGMECARKGIAVGLLEEKTNKVYVLLPKEDKGTLPAAVIDKMGRKATVTGRVYMSGGSQFLTVESVK